MQMKYKIFFHSGKKYILPVETNIINLISKSFQNIKNYSKERIEPSIILKLSQEYIDILKYQGKTYNFIYKEWRSSMNDGRKLLYLLKKRKKQKFIQKKNEKKNEK